MAELAPPTFETANSLWHGIDGQFRALIERRDALSTALSLVSNPADFESDRTEKAREFAGPFIERARRRPDLVLAELRDLDEKIAELQPVHARAREDWFAARRRETFRLADALKPKHMAAVKVMATALEKLSAAAKVERDIRRELERIAPEPNSGLLPDFGLPCVNVQDWGTASAEWSRRVANSGLLK